MSTKKFKPKPATKSMQAKSPTPDAGYAGHKQGSRKGTIHELFDREGDDVAWTRGIKIGLKEGTLRSWFAYWRRLQGKTEGAKAKVNSAAKPAEAAAV